MKEEQQPTFLFLVIQTIHTSHELIITKKSQEHTLPNQFAQKQAQ